MAQLTVVSTYVRSIGNIGETSLRIAASISTSAARSGFLCLRHPASLRLSHPSQANESASAAGSHRPLFRAACGSDVFAAERQLMVAVGFNPRWPNASKLRSLQSDD